MTRTILVCLALFASVISSLANSGLCATCGKRLGNTIYEIKRSGYAQKAIVCNTCGKLPTRCYSCGLPVIAKSGQLADGRALCDADARQAVFTQFDAERLFDDVKREVQSTLAQLGPLPHQNISLTLETKDRLDKTGADLISNHEDSLLMGLTRSRRKRDGEFAHEIFLLHGLTRARMMVVSAHEYGHAWIHENVKRPLDRNTHEGFCDWIAYKIIQQKNEPQETRVLLASDYSRGQLQAFIAAEKEYGFYHVMNWVKNGADTRVDATRLNRILVMSDGKVVNDAPAASTTTLFAGIPVAAPAKATNLVLKGLSGTAARRFAMINDGTFMANEQAKVRLGDSNVLVHCLQIGNDSVVVQVAGETTPRTLTLSKQ